MPSRVSRSHNGKDPAKRQPAPPITPISLNNAPAVLSWGTTDRWTESLSSIYQRGCGDHEGQGVDVTTAIVLSGGGNLGAMQAGSVVALLEAGIKPDLLVGSSVGAMNSAFLATHPGLEGAIALRDAWVTLRRAEAIQLDPLLAFMGF